MARLKKVPARVRAVPPSSATGYTVAGGVTSSFTIGKAVLTLTADETTDIVTAKAVCAGAAKIEFQFGESTGTYHASVFNDSSEQTYQAISEAVFCQARAIAVDGTAGEWSDEATITLSVNDMVSFTFPEAVGEAVINDSAHTVAINVEPETVVTALVAEFAVSAGATVKIGSAVQESEVTENDFTSPVVYAVKSSVADGAVTQNWTVTVTVLASEKDFLTYTLPGQVGENVINATVHTIGVTVPDDTNVTALVATFTMSADASCKIGVTPQVSASTANNFTSPKTYTTIGKDLSEQAWTITVTVLKDAGKSLTAFTLPGQVGQTTINQTNKTVAVALPHGTAVTALAATFTISAESAATVAAAAQTSGVTQNNFTSPVVYRVTAEDLTYVDYTVTVTVNAATNNFTAFTVPAESGTTTINATAHTIGLTVPHGTAVTALVATFGLTAGAAADVSDTPQESAVTANNFTSPVVYTVTGADAAEQNWTVTVTVAATTNHITAFSLAEQTGAATITAATHTVAIEVAFGTDVDSLVATFALTSGASAKVGNTTQVSADTQNDFTAPVVYAVTGADTVVQNWTVTVSVAAE